MLSDLKYVFFIILLVIPSLGEARKAQNPEAGSLNVGLEYTDTQTTLLSRDGTAFSIESELLHQSPLLSHLLEQHPDAEISLDSVDSQTLELLIDYLQCQSPRSGEGLEGVLEEGIDQLMCPSDLNFVSRVCQRNPDFMYHLYLAAKRLELSLLEKVSLASIVQLEKVNQAAIKRSKKLSPYIWQKSCDQGFIDAIFSMSPDSLKPFLNLYWNKSGLESSSLNI